MDNYVTKVTYGLFPTASKNSLYSLYTDYYLLDTLKDQLHWWYLGPIEPRQNSDGVLVQLNDLECLEVEVQTALGVIPSIFDRVAASQLRYERMEIKNVVYFRIERNKEYGILPL